MRVIDIIVAALVSFFGILVLWLLVMAFLDEVKAHEWYPPRCCSGKDCASIDKWLPTPDGGAIVVNKFGSFKLTKEWMAANTLPSEDFNSHICVRCVEWKGAGCVKLEPRERCLFVGGGV